MARPAADLGGGRLGTRIVSSVVMAALAISAAFFGGFPFFVLIAAGAAILAWEWNRMCGYDRFGVPGCLLLAAVWIAAGAAAVGRPDLGLAASLAASLLLFPLAARLGGGRAAHLAAGALYIGVPAVALLWLRGQGAEGGGFILWLFAVVWASDIAAYFVGKSVGGPRLAPRISPNKTWSGLVGGVAAGVLAGYTIALLVPEGLDWRLVLVMSAVVAGASVLGDLVESAVKRGAGIKDAGTIIPGHGGLFDRVDGLLAAAPAAALSVWGAGGSVLGWR